MELANLAQLCESKADVVRREENPKPARQRGEKEADTSPLEPESGRYKHAHLNSHIFSSESQQPNPPHVGLHTGKVMTASISARQARLVSVTEKLQLKPSFS